MVLIITTSQKSCITHSYIGSVGFVHNKNWEYVNTNISGDGYRKRFIIKIINPRIFNFNNVLDFEEATIELFRSIFSGLFISNPYQNNDTIQNVSIEIGETPYSIPKKLLWKGNLNQYRYYTGYDGAQIAHIVMSELYSYICSYKINSDNTIQHFSQNTLQESSSTEQESSSTELGEYKMLEPEEQEAIKADNDKEILIGFISICIIFTETIFCINSEHQRIGWFPFYSNMISIILASHTLENIDTRFISLPFLHITIAINIIFALFSIKYWNSFNGLIGFIFIGIFFFNPLWDLKRIRILGYCNTYFSLVNNDK